MNISNGTSFKARSYEIRRADKIAREVSKLWPMLSSSKLGSLSNADQFSNALVRLNKSLTKTRNEAIKALSPFGSSALSPKDRILTFLGIMKRLRN